jgi:hypothetical protein
MFYVFVFVLLVACLAIVAVVFREELRPRVEAFLKAARESRERSQSLAAHKQAAHKAAKSRTVRVEGMVSGVTFKNPDGRDRQKLIKKLCHEGVEMTLGREPDNPRDANAVAIYIHGSQIGYVPSEDAAEVARHLDAGGSATSSVLRVYGGTPEKRNLGVNFRIELA